MNDTQKCQRCKNGCLIAVDGNGSGSCDCPCHTQRCNCHCHVTGFKVCIRCKCHTSPLETLREEIHIYLAQISGTELADSWLDAIMTAVEQYREALAQKVEGAAMPGELSSEVFAELPILQKMHNTAIKEAAAIIRNG